MQLRLATHAMGTRFELVLEGDDEAQLRAAGEAALYELEEAHGRLSLFAKDSLLAHLNRTGAARPVRVDVDTWELLVACDEVARASDGAFDPTVAPLMRARGFRDDAPSDVDAARAHVGWDAVVLDPAHLAVSFARAGVELDLGAIGKGHGLDLAAGVLRDEGVERGLLHGGTSSVVALGPPVGARAWRVRLGPDPGDPVAELTHCALAVSAPRGRTLELDGRTHGHVLDPRTGASAEHASLAAVVAPDATRADAWSTALLVAGERLPAAPHIETLFQADGVWRHRTAEAPARFTQVPLRDIA